ncbi:DHHC palmitoyltransferase-domain-containing protein [Apiosordaria backusii]|uniref:Palmitoyltransferase PFA4 n=1 Tax=Apiosordaria backusii TaxID=314023 RepID=A0AA40K6I6_9PEZI|nr:DHHC palmitoyltransferase-domain-containing protein [Apiosordaria backusii]
MTQPPLTGPQTPGLHLLYVPAVVALITFQGYFSQYLFNTSPDLRPGPLTFRENVTFNILLLCLWWTYHKACTIDPGRFVFSPSSDNDKDNNKQPKSPPNKRFCKKCQSPKPPRAHHCRHCARCIPRMDHHCPWTNNCVSLTTFPHFLRFLLYTNLALLYLSNLLYTRLSAIWSDRHLPSYLGPSLSSLISLTLLTLANFGTFFALFILLVTTLKSWVVNQTLIEMWELDRHNSLLSKISSSASNNDYWTDDFDPAALSRIEFPYDLGFFKNMSQAMGTSNPLRWFLPVGGGGPKLADQKRGGLGWEYEENGFNDWEGMWPPPDVEKERRAKQGGWAYKQQQDEQERRESDYYYGGNGFGGGEDIKAAFERRQQEDFARRQRLQQLGTQSGIIGELEEDEDEREWVGKKQQPPEGWRNSEGDRLWDYGVDEDEDEDDYVTREEVIGGEGEDDDDVPLAELIRRRKVLTKQDDDS